MLREDRKGKRGATPRETSGEEPKLDIQRGYGRLPKREAAAAGARAVRRRRHLVLKS